MCSGRFYSTGRHPQSITQVVFQNHLKEDQNFPTYKKKMIPEEVEMLPCAQSLHVVQFLDYNLTPHITEKKSCVI